jgi:hypothetical protein
MTPLRWAAFAIGLVGAFLVSMAAGGFIARQLHSPAAAPPVAMASPSAVPSSTFSPSLAPTPTTQTQPPASVPSTVGASSTESATPLGTPVPTPTVPATSSPTFQPSIGPSDAPTTPPSGQPSGSPTALPTVLLDPATAEEFATDLAAAISDGQNPYLVARLHPATIDRYGLAQCRAYIRDTISGSPITWEVQSSAGPAPWDYVTDDLTTTIPDAWAVTVRQPGADPEIRDLHFAPFEGTWRWFTDCGEPL